MPNIFDPIESDGDDAIRHAKQAFIDAFTKQGHKERIESELFSLTYDDRKRLRLCCFIPDQTKPDRGCQNIATFQIWLGDNPTPDDYTETCDEHLLQMLDDSSRFELIRITEKE